MCICTLHEGTWVSKQSCIQNNYIIFWSLINFWNIPTKETSKINKSTPRNGNTIITGYYDKINSQTHNHNLRPNHRTIEKIFHAHFVDEILPQTPLKLKLRTSLPRNSNAINFWNLYFSKGDLYKQIVLIYYFLKWRYNFPLFILNNKYCHFM